MLGALSDEELPVALDAGADVSVWTVERAQVSVAVIRANSSVRTRASSGGARALSAVSKTRRHHARSSAIDRW